MGLTLNWTSFLTVSAVFAISAVSANPSFLLAPIRLPSCLPKSIGYTCTRDTVPCSCCQVYCLQHIHFEISAAVKFIDHLPKKQFLVPQFEALVNTLIHWRPTVAIQAVMNSSLSSCVCGNSQCKTALTGSLPTNPTVHDMITI